MGIPGSKSDLIPELKNINNSIEFFQKKHYSSFVDTELLQKLKNHNIKDVYLVGINTKCCIFATALDSVSRGKFKTYIINDGVSSIHGKQAHAQGLECTNNVLVTT